MKSKNNNKQNVVVHAKMVETFVFKKPLGFILEPFDTISEHCSVGCRVLKSNKKDEKVLPCFIDGILKLSFWNILGPIFVSKAITYLKAKIA